jgi:hypothetical protein
VGGCRDSLDHFLVGPNRTQGGFGYCLEGDGQTALPILNGFRPSKVDPNTIRLDLYVPSDQLLVVIELIWVVRD